ncbi:MAG: carboxypeptidase regulatory-like domain-containing protein [Myxococcales bacterium]|nr:carboxypeptidase regulatory-like domain-containing protein [Myxococcales bacterium]
MGNALPMNARRWISDKRAQRAKWAAAGLAEDRPRKIDRALLALALALGASCSSGKDTAGRAGPLGCLTIAVTPKKADAPATLTAQSTLDDQGYVWKRTWTVTRAGEKTPLPFVPKDAAQTAITVDATDPGTYHFALTVSHAGDFCTASDDATVQAQGAKTAAYRLRFTPPVASGLPRQERIVILRGKTPLDHQEFRLADGLPVDGKLAGPKGGAGVPGTLRFLSDAGLDVLAAAGPDGKFSALLLADDKYRMVIVPALDGLAPRLGPHAAGAVLAVGAFSVDAGAKVSGQVKDEAGQPLPGARVVLAAGPLPSSVGLTDALGAFTLHAAPGDYAVTVQADGRPDIQGASSSVKDGAQLAIAYLPGQVAAAIKVVASDGATGMSGARVVVRSTQMGKVAKVTWGQGAPADADGAVRVARLTAQDGSLPPLLLPPGEYDVLCEPPPGAADGATRVHFTLAQAASWKVALQPRTRVKGLLSDGNAPIPSVRVTAIEQGGFGVTVTTRTADDGTFELPVDAAAGADLFFDPPLFSDPNRHFQRAHKTLAPGAARADLTLVRGLLLRGQVAPPAGAPLAFALVEAWCATCEDTTAAGLATTGPDGTFVMYLPDPGL